MMRLEKFRALKPIGVPGPAAAAGGVGVGRANALAGAGLGAAAGRNPVAIPNIGALLEGKRKEDDKAMLSVLNTIAANTKKDTLAQAVLLEPANFGD